MTATPPAAPDRAAPPGRGGPLSRLLARAQELPLRHRSLRWVVLALGIVLAVASAWRYDYETRRVARLRFQVFALDQANDVELRVRAYRDVLYSMRGLFDASNRVTRDDFRRFAEALSLGERYPGLTNISFTARVPRQGKDAFERAIRAQRDARDGDLPRFAIKPPGERPEYAVLTYIEPMGRNVVAWGLDLNADPQRRAVVERARDSGSVSASVGVTLVRDSASPVTSTLMRLAVYRGGRVPETLEERRRLYWGLVGSTMRVDELVEAAIPKEVLSRLQLRIFMSGGEGTGAPQLLYDSRRAQRPAAAEYAAYAASHNIPVGDHEWRLEFTPLEAPVEPIDRAMPAAILVVALAISALLFWLLSSLGTILGLRDKLLDQAMHDPLTGLYNRRYMEEWFRHELYRARRHGRPVGVVMVDVDHFKRINDSLGHEAGDVVLRELARVIRNAARASDVVCRCGGEEFLVLMPEASAAGAARKAEELRAAVEALRLEFQGRPVGPLTISLGVCGFPKDAQDAEPLLRYADEALYAAKQGGRNRVVVATA